MQPCWQTNPPLPTRCYNFFQFQWLNECNACVMSEANCFSCHSLNSNGDDGNFLQVEMKKLKTEENNTAVMGENWVTSLSPIVTKPRFNRNLVNTRSKHKFLFSKKILSLNLSRTPTDEKRERVFGHFYISYMWLKWVFATLTLFNVGQYCKNQHWCNLPPVLYLQ